MILIQLSEQNCGCIICKRCSRQLYHIRTVKITLSGNVRMLERRPFLHRSLNIITAGASRCFILVLMYKMIQPASEMRTSGAFSQRGIKYNNAMEIL
jgi:hypothetical protein